MFPYPSGALHMGHLRVYTIADVLARFHRMQRDSAGNAYRVVFPIGFDSFGLPAENAAIDRKVDPRAWTEQNIAAMSAQLRSMDTSFDWDREVWTSDPSYYKWTQYIFLKLYEHGLVYRKSSTVNWDPIDQTVLANEQVDAEGRAERSGAVVEKRKLEQWFFKITQYQDELLSGLESLNWPARIKQLQGNWIGKEEGYQVAFKLSGVPSEDITVFFANPDYAASAEYVAISWDHPLIESSARKLPVFVSGGVPEMEGNAVLGASTVDAKDSAFGEKHNIPQLKDKTNSPNLDPYKTTKVSELLPVSTYIGGIEHAILHLLYARFIGKFLFKSGIVPQSGSSAWDGEPFKRLLAQGMVTGRTAKCPATGRYLKPEEVDWTDLNAPIMKVSGKHAILSQEKMSKSKYNGVDPSEMIEKYGSDCTRLYVLYKAAPADELLWDEHGIIGMQRWLGRCRKLAQTVFANRADVAVKLDGTNANATRAVLDSTIRDVTLAMTKTYAFHVAIAALMKLTNHLEKVPEAEYAHSVYMESMRSLTQMLSPFAPAVSNELWSALSVAKKQHVSESAWPVVAVTDAAREFSTCTLMVNGKVRGTITVPAQLMVSEDALRAAAVQSDIGKRWLVDRTTGGLLQFDKVLVLKMGRVINFLIKK
ncbi:hypothetical protein HDU82_008059 [Entophlyctis luteolus]|nr:hypothetical protein HDU82_008059 [Entophlyctis luteolus]